MIAVDDARRPADKLDRIEQLRRRVQPDPAFVVFAALNEQYRKASRAGEAARPLLTRLRQ